MKWNAKHNTDNLLGSYATGDSPGKTFNILYDSHITDFIRHEKSTQLGHKTNINFIINLQADTTFNKAWKYQALLFLLSQNMSNINQSQEIWGNFNELIFGFAL